MINKKLQVCVACLSLGLALSSMSVIEANALGTQTKKVTTSATIITSRSIADTPYDTQPWNYSTVGGMSKWDNPVNTTYYQQKLQAISKLLVQEPKMKAVNADVSYWANRLSLRSDPSYGACTFMGTYNGGTYYRSIYLNALTTTNVSGLDSSPWIYTSVCPGGMSIWDNTANTSYYQTKIQAITKLLKQEPVMSAISTDPYYWANKLSLRTDPLTGVSKFMSTKSGGTYYRTIYINDPITIV